MGRNYYGGNSVGKVLVNIFLTIFAIAVLLALTILIYCSVKGLTFDQGFLEMFSFLSNKNPETTARVCSTTITNLKM